MGRDKNFGVLIGRFRSAAFSYRVAFGFTGNGQFADFRASAIPLLVILGVSPQFGFTGNGQFAGRANCPLRIFGVVVILISWRHSGLPSIGNFYCKRKDRTHN
ncbi:MAG: hypothetical protein FWD01_02955 [Defluviitaleaceae bacterium]|nr:hypothetical protein [Defluviitaleaceae bacterium]